MEEQVDIKNTLAQWKENTMKKNLIPLLIGIILLTACSPAATPVPTATVPTAAPSPTPEPAGITLIYENNAQFELITSTGRHIYMDVIDPAQFNAQPTANDILLTTHPHDDHYYKSFAIAFPGQQLFEVTGKIEYPEVTVWTLAAPHNSNDPIVETNATNYICVIDTAGLRIAHFGDIGQDALTNAQLAALGKVDVAITQFNNPYSNMDQTNQKGTNLMAQVMPLLIIPHSHQSKATLQQAAERWGGYYTTSTTLKLSPANMPAKTSLLTLGVVGAAYGSLFNLAEWK
jgi:hypothetical protein